MKKETLKEYIDRGGKVKKCRKGVASGVRNEEFEEYILMGDLRLLVKYYNRGRRNG